MTTREIMKVGPIAGTSRKIALKVYYALLDKIIFFVARFDKCKLYRFGTFEIKRTKKRDYIMPDGKKIVSGNYMKIKFTPARYFRYRVAEIKEMKGIWNYDKKREEEE